MIIPTKTALGHAELRRRTHPLGQRHRTILVLVDGKRALAEVLSLAQHAGATIAHFEELVRLGLVDVPTAAVAAVPSEPPPEPPVVAEVVLAPAPVDGPGDGAPGPAQSAPPLAAPDAPAVEGADPGVAEAPVAGMAEGCVAEAPVAQVKAAEGDEGSATDPPVAEVAEGRGADAPAAEVPESGVPGAPAAAMPEAAPAEAPAAATAPAPKHTRRPPREMPVLAVDAAVDPLHEIRGLLLETLHFDAPVFSARMFVRVRAAASAAELIDLVWEIQGHLAGRHAPRRLVSLQRARELLGLGNTLVAEDTTPPPLHD